MSPSPRWRIAQHCLLESSKLRQSLAPLTPFMVRTRSISVECTPGCIGDRAGHDRADAGRCRPLAEHSILPSRLPGVDDPLLCRRGLPDQQLLQADSPARIAVFVEWLRLHGRHSSGAVSCVYERLRSRRAAAWRYADAELVVVLLAPGLDGHVVRLCPGGVAQSGPPGARSRRRVRRMRHGNADCVGGQRAGGYAAARLATGERGFTMPDCAYRSPSNPGDQGFTGRARRRPAQSCAARAYIPPALALVGLPVTSTGVVTDLIPAAWPAPRSPRRPRR